jgi:hypothetical protein
MSIPTVTGQHWPPLSTQALTAVGGMVPTLIESTETFVIPAKRQALVAMAIDIEGELVIDGYLIEVN